ncbi:MAG: histone deacetylase [Elusimicrobiota bacterium]
MIHPVKIIYSPLYEVDIGTHVFPTAKYRLIKDHLMNKYNLPGETFIEPRLVEKKEILRIHTEDYVGDIENGTLSYADEIRLELPYSRELAKAALLCCGGTILACQEAIRSGNCIHLGGGFHHAYPDHGEGFCIFNDIAVAAAVMADSGKKVLIIDCDLHQGNGTAKIFEKEEKVFTFSIHQQNNYPFYKEKSDLDIGLEDLTTGEEYNRLLTEGIRRIKKIFDPEIIIYVAGSDTYTDDQLGGISLSMDDLKKRDVIIKTEAGDIPVAVVLAGGYAKNIEDTVLIHSNTAEVIAGL